MFWDMSRVTPQKKGILDAHSIMSVGFQYPLEGKAVPLQALTGPEGSRRLRLPDLETIGT